MSKKNRNKRKNIRPKSAPTLSDVNAPDTDLNASDADRAAGNVFLESVKDFSEVPPGKTSVEEQPIQEASAPADGLESTKRLMEDSLKSVSQVSASRPEAARPPEEILALKKGHLPGEAAEDPAEKLITENIGESAAVPAEREEAASAEENAPVSDKRELIEEYEKQFEEAEKRREQRQKRREEASKNTDRKKTRQRITEPIKYDPGADAVKKAVHPAITPAISTEGSGGDEEGVKTYIPKNQSQKPAPKEDLAQELTKALSEDGETILSAEGDIAETDDTTPAAVQGRPNKFYLVFAVFIIIMSVVGIVSTVNFGIDLVSDIVNRTEIKNEIALFLYPTVCVDPPACESVSNLPSSIVVEAAIWRIILTGDNTNYEKQYNTYMYVPAVDVEFSVRSIFGNSVNIEHQTVGSVDITFTYIPEQNSYLVPINPHYTAYSPRITELSNIGELFTVTVDYIPPSALSVDGLEFEVTPTKTMVYTISKSKNSATIHSIRNATVRGNSYEY